MDSICEQGMDSLEQKVRLAELKARLADERATRNQAMLTQKMREVNDLQNTLNSQTKVSCNFKRCQLCGVVLFKTRIFFYWCYIQQPEPCLTWIILVYLLNIQQWLSGRVGSSALLVVIIQALILIVKLCSHAQRGHKSYNSL